MECPICEKELTYHDSYFTGNYSAYAKGYEGSGYQELGEIFKCENVKCEGLENIYHTRNENDSELHDGHPC